MSQRYEAWSRVTALESEWPLMFICLTGTTTKRSRCW